MDAACPTMSTQPCIPLGSLHRVPVLIGWRKGKDVTSAGCQITLCDPIRHVSSRSGEVCCKCHTQLLYYLAEQCIPGWQYCNLSLGVLAPSCSNVVLFLFLGHLLVQFHAAFVSCRHTCFVFLCYIMFILVANKFDLICQRAGIKKNHASLKRLATHSTILLMNKLLSVVTIPKFSFMVSFGRFQLF